MKTRHLGRTTLTAGVLAAAQMLVSGCAHPQAKTALEPPRLNVPAPPPRVIETAEVELPPAPEEPVLAAPVAGARPAPSAPSRPARAAAEPPKAEPVPAEAAGPKPEEGPRAMTPSPLQTVPPQQERGEETKVRALMSAAEKSLSRVDYRALGTAERTQYDQAKGFVREADEALKAKQLVFARSLAEKAATLAAQLAGR